MPKGVVSVAIDEHRSSEHVASSSCTLALGNKEARVFGNSRAQSLLSAREEILQQMGIEKPSAVHTNAVGVKGSHTKRDTISGWNIVLGGSTPMRGETGDFLTGWHDWHDWHDWQEGGCARCTTVASFLATQSVVFSIDKCKTVDSMIMSAHFRSALLSIRSTVTPIPFN